MSKRMQAVKAAFQNPERVTVRLPVVTMRDDTEHKRDFHAEYADRGYQLSEEKIELFAKDLLGYSPSEACYGFIELAGLVAIKVYEAGLNGKPISDVVPWIEK